MEGGVGAQGEVRVGVVGEVQAVGWGMAVEAGAGRAPGLGLGRGAEVQALEVGAAEGREARQGEKAAGAAVGGVSAAVREGKEMEVAALGVKAVAEG